MRFVVIRDAEEFALAAESLLSVRTENNVLATVLMNVREGYVPAEQALFALGLDESGRVSFAALRTRPWPLLASELPAGDAPALVDRWLEADPELSGVNGPAATSRAIADAWRVATGGQVRPGMRQALHVLTEVSDPPRPAPGRLRLPAAEERPLLVTWLEGFIADAGIHGAGRADDMVATYLARGSLQVWDDGGPVSMVVANPQVAGAVRVGMVYTPHEHRRRGYAGTAVAAISREVLAAGASRCVLFTDLANPTSNKIYAEVGYERVADWEEWELVPAGGA
jgi:predicted GNAT family acetyltransferase